MLWGGKKEKRIHAASIVILCGVTSILWMNVAGKFLLYTNSSEQIRSILTDPLNFLTILVRTWYRNAVEWVLQMLGFALGWMNIRVDNILLALYGIILVLAFSNGAGKKNSDRPVWMDCAALIFCVALLISTALYVQWTQVNASEIDGIQGRYFIPLLLPFYFMLNSGKSARMPEKPDICLMSVAAGVNACVGSILLTSTL